jgi:hypothetical protein
MVPLYGRCVDCDRASDGKCRVCHGTGQNVHLSSDSPDCEHCRGGGACPICKGLGYPGDDDIIDISDS